MAAPRAESDAYLEACRLRGLPALAGPEPPPGTAANWRPVKFQHGTLFVPADRWIAVQTPDGNGWVQPVGFEGHERIDHVNCSVTKWHAVTRSEVIEMADESAQGQVRRRDLTVAGHRVLEQQYDIDTGDGIIIYPSLERWYAFGDDALMVGCSGTGHRSGFLYDEDELRAILDTFQAPESADGRSGWSPVCRQFDQPTHDGSGDETPVALAPVVLRGNKARIHWSSDEPIACGQWFDVVPVAGGPATHAYVDDVRKHGERFWIGARISGAKPAAEPQRPAGLPTDVVVVLESGNSPEIRRLDSSEIATLKTPETVVAGVVTDYGDGDSEWVVFSREPQDGGDCVRTSIRAPDGTWTTKRPRC